MPPPDVILTGAPAPVSRHTLDLRGEVHETVLDALQFGARVADCNGVPLRFFAESVLQLSKLPDALLRHNAIVQVAASQRLQLLTHFSQPSLHALERHEARTHCLAVSRAAFASARLNDSGAGMGRVSR
jgi:hypothetical protein